MRILLLSIVMLGLFASATRADDAAAAIWSKFPDNTRNQQVIFFKLKENDITLRITAEEFCSQLGYGEVVQYHHDHGDPEPLAGVGNIEIDKDTHKQIPGTLDWVVCQFPKTR